MNTPLLDGISKEAIGGQTVSNALGQISKAYSPAMNAAGKSRFLNTLYRLGQGSARGSNLNAITGQFRNAISRGAQIPAAPGGAGWSKFLGGLTSRGADMSRQFIR